MKADTKNSEIVSFFFVDIIINRCIMYGVLALHTINRFQDIGKYDTSIKPINSELRLSASGSANI